MSALDDIRAKKDAETDYIDLCILMIAEVRQDFADQAAAELAELHAELDRVKTANLFHRRLVVIARGKWKETLAELDKWEEREGAICPEDVGFDEYIQQLQRKLAAKDAALEEAKMKQNAAFTCMKCGHNNLNLYKAGDA